ncbi:HEPN domain-containing protein [Rapidithrix thailandica]|uniref:HEPN domain-containing protein n=1 Tax=Rapidithrix thailandica TaxID=413964 RepID=A0AAW9S7J2_9BACT
MLSFRTELENPVVEKDIIDLEKKILSFKNGTVDEEKFRSLRLARGIYGQRQPGVQMIRIKIPYGRLTTKQLRKISDISDEYSTGKLHATTRQDIQIHHVSLDKTPELWAKLEEDKITLREACGNTVRNVTASAKAGIDPKEAFDVSPYAHATFEYFLRNPICQEMGRKFKIAFSSSEEDSAFAFIHDVGVIPQVKIENGEEVRGFKVYVGGGLGANPWLAEKAYDFLPEDELIPFMEALIRVFDRHGERTRRMKARLKFLLRDIGLEELLRLVEAEKPALKSSIYKVDRNLVPEIAPSEAKEIAPVEIADQKRYQTWLDTNVFEQKQKDFYGVFVRVPLGDFSTKTARALAELVDQYAGDDIRVTVNQGYLLRFVRKEALAALYTGLDRLGLAKPGFDSTADITACPGTDTCNLGIASSTGIAAELERVIHAEYPDLVKNNDIKIKISGCPNSCGQHGIASVGFHGSSLKYEGNIMPALQVLLGGSVLNGGEGRIAEKVIKVPSKRGPEVLRWVLQNYEDNRQEGEYFSDYYVRQGKIYFYDLLKPLAVLEDIEPGYFQDWGSEHKFALHKAVGECAGVIIDLVQTLLFESDEKFELAEQNLHTGAYADAIYHAYAVYVNSAKALLLDKKTRTNNQVSILKAFDTHYVETGEFIFDGSFEEHVLKINKNEPSRAFAQAYVAEAKAYLQTVRAYREKQVKQEKEQLPVA